MKEVLRFPLDIVAFVGWQSSLSVPVEAIVCWACAFIGWVDDRSSSSGLLVYGLHIKRRSLSTQILDTGELLSSSGLNLESQRSGQERLQITRAPDDLLQVALTLPTLWLISWART